LEAKLAVQVPGQVIPAGLLVTDPVPVTATVRESPPLKAAATLVAAVRVTVHVLAVPEQVPPLQPLKKLFVAGCSVKVTFVLDAKLAEHVPGQLIPFGLLVTVPVVEVGPVTVNLTLVLVGVGVGEGVVPSPWHPARKKRPRTKGVESASLC
jgi:hypothetical protein